MNRQDRAKFVESYSKTLTKAWSDASYKKALLANPAATLKAAGFSVPANVKVNVITDIRGTGTLEDQLKIWETGIVKGSVDLYVPNQPQLKEGELSDQQLEAVAGGADCCCSCTPCCTCT